MKNRKGNYTLMGAIVGDYMGSKYEFMPTKQLEFPIDKLHSNITDDSILTIAIADALLSGIPYKYALHYWAIKFPSPMGGYGGSFILFSTIASCFLYASCANFHVEYFLFFSTYIISFSSLCFIQAQLLPAK